MLPRDWERAEEELRDARKARAQNMRLGACRRLSWQRHRLGVLTRNRSFVQVVTDGLAHTHRHVKHSPDTIVPVLSKKQIIPGQTYLILTGWYKQQCVIVLPEARP